MLKISTKLQGNLFIHLVSTVLNYRCYIVTGWINFLLVGSVSSCLVCCCAFVDLLPHVKAKLFNPIPLNHHPVPLHNWTVSSNLWRCNRYKKNYPNYPNIIVIGKIIGSGQIDSFMCIESVIASISIFNVVKRLIIVMLSV